MAAPIKFAFLPPDVAADKRPRGRPAQDLSSWHLRLPSEWTPRLEKWRDKHSPGNSLQAAMRQLIGTALNAEDEATARAVEPVAEAGHNVSDPARPNARPRPAK